LRIKRRGQMHPIDSHGDVNVMSFERRPRSIEQRNSMMDIEFMNYAEVLARLVR
jgi:hypothetical protein